jgi:hypothetical protein
MKQIYTRYVAFAISMLFFGLAGFAQGVTSSSISGQIKDNEGNTLPGASVMALHSPTGTIYGATTNEQGLFIIQNMQPGGPYKVNVSFMGYASKVVENITLQLGQNYKLNLSLSPASTELSEVDVVDDKNALINSDRMGTAVNLDVQSVNELPTINRDINDYTRLIPQSNGTSFAGRDNRFNNYTIDGNIYNNNFGLGNSQFAGGNPISIDAIQEIQVNLAPYDVNQNGFTGANVNAITRSGSNTFEGSAYVFARNQNLVGNNVYDEELSVGESFNRIIGARVGGPIIKNKLFFFASLEYEDELAPGDQRKASRPGLEPDGLNISRVPAAELDDVRSMLQSLYGYDAGDYENKEFESNALRLNLRFDYNINENHRAFIRFNRFSSYYDTQINGNSIRYLPSSLRLTNTNRYGIEAMNFRNSDYGVNSTITSVVGELNSRISDNISNSLNIGFTSVTDPERQIPGEQDFPFIEVLEPDASGNSLYYMSMGNELYSVGNLLENKVFNITNNISYFMGKHTISGGFNFEFMSFENAFNPVFNGFYRYNTYDAFYQSVIMGDASVVPDAFAQGYAFDGSSNPPVDAINFSQLGIYAQDKVVVSEKFNFTVGLRIEMPFFPNDLPRNEKVEEYKLWNPLTQDSIVPDVSVLPGFNPLFNPRFGFNYNPLENGRLQIRGGAGLFSGRFPFVWVSNQVNANGVTRGGYGLTPTQWGTGDNPAWDGFQSDVSYYRPDPSGLEAQLTRDVNLTDENFKLPQIFRTNLGVDYDLGNRWYVTFEGIFSKDIHTPISVNTALAEPDVTWEEVGGNGDTRPAWSSSSVAYPGQFSNAYLLTNADANGDYYALTLQVRKDHEIKPEMFIGGSLAYTRSRARDYGLEGGSQASSLWAFTVQEDRNDPEISYTRFDQPNRWVGDLTYRYKGFSASIVYIGQNSGRYSYTYSGNIGDGSNRLMYIPNSRDEIQLIDIVNSQGDVIKTADEQWAALDAFIEQDEYLSENRGNVAERNGALLPFVHRFDLRLMQDVAEFKNSKQKLQITLDVLNIGNLFSSEWGVFQQATQPRLLQYRGVDAQGRPQFTMNYVSGTSDFPEESYRPVLNLSQVWSAQVGIRFLF